MNHLHIQDKRHQDLYKLVYNDKINKKDKDELIKEKQQVNQHTNNYSEMLYAYMKAK